MDNTSTWLDIINIILEELNRGRVVQQHSSPAMEALHSGTHPQEELKQSS